MHAQPGCERRVHTPRYTPPAEVYLRYICALTSSYAGWPSQPEQGRTRRDSDGRRGGYGQPADQGGAELAGTQVGETDGLGRTTGDRGHAGQ
jgi:hypothetical protein